MLESNSKDVEELGKYILDARNFTSDTTAVENFTGNLDLIDGQMEKQNVTVFHNNSIAEDVVFYQGGEPSQRLA